MLLGLAACDGPTASGPIVDAGNVDFLLGAQVEHTDTGVVVEGRTILHHPSNEAALWLDRFDHFRHGGFPDLDYPQSARRHLTWRILLTHRYPPEQRDGRTLYRFVDHGEALVAGTEMTKLTDVPHFHPDHPLQFENFVRYLSNGHVHVDWLTGAPTLDERAPYFEALVAGEELAVRTTGSAEVEPASGAFSVRPFAELAAIDNGAEVPLDGAMPVIHADEPLGLTFNRPLDPAHAYIVLIPFQSAEARRAVVQPRTAAERVVIPVDALRELVAGAGSTPVAYIMIVVEAHAADDVLTGRFRDDTGVFSLPFVQRSETTLHFRLQH